MLSSHKIIIVLKLPGELRALSIVNIGKQTFVPTLSFENFSLVDLNIFWACFLRKNDFTFDN